MSVMINVYILKRCPRRRKKGNSCRKQASKYFKNLRRSSLICPESCFDYNGGKDDYQQIIYMYALKSEVPGIMRKT